MRIHHLNCATMCPPGGLLTDVCAHDRVELEALQRAPAEITRTIQQHHHERAPRHA